MPQSILCSTIHIKTAAAQAMSFGLTQYDMEELMAHTDNKCKSVHHLCVILALGLPSSD